MELREFAERVLFATTLEEKLLRPADITDERPGSALVTPAAPGRPKELQFKVTGEARDSFPGTKNLGQESERGRLLHFFANVGYAVAPRSVLLASSARTAVRAHRLSPRPQPSQGALTQWKITTHLVRRAADQSRAVEALRQLVLGRAVTTQRSGPPARSASNG